MTTQQFLILNLVLLGFFVLLFFRGKRGAKAPSNLKVTLPSEKSMTSDQSLLKSEIPLNVEFQNDTKQAIDSHFIYNGHTWDAYEVLGVPPGSSVEAIRTAFEQSIQRTNVNSHDFLKSALSTILKEMKAKGYRP